MTHLTLVSPLTGWSAPLDEVPDPVFADKIMGDGLAIDPVEGVLCAPCDGTVSMAAPHAVSIKADNGAEILLHIGLETVALKGEGFVSATQAGARVRAGDVLIRFDLALLGRKVESLISPMIVANSDAFQILSRVTGRAVKTGDVLMDLVPLGLSVVATAPAASLLSRTVTIKAVHGLHARPAARIAGLARKFSSAIALVHGAGRADARSTTAMMRLGVACGDRVTIEVNGSDGEAAMSALLTLLENGLDDGDVSVAPAPAPPTNAAISGESENRLAGICAVPGLALGQTVLFHQADLEIAEIGRGLAQEREGLNQALAEVRGKIAALGNTPTQKAIAEAHLALLDDPELEEAAQDLLAQGKSAGFAWRSALRAAAAQLQDLSDPRLRERAGDLRDLERQVLTVLSGAAAPVMALPPDAILLADDLLPSELMALDASRLKGLVTAKGGATSHVAIMAAALNIPALVGAGSRVTEIALAQMVLLDATAGALELNLDAVSLEQARGKIAAAEAVRVAARAEAGEDCRTADGMRIEVFANLGSGAEEAAAAVAQGAEGCGLLRSEFLFMERQTAPSEAEQVKAYQAVTDALAGRPLILRTLDIGADKPAPYLSFPAEANPVLGLRGLRLSWRWPDLMATQLKAALRVVPQPRLMLPMVMEAAEIAAIRAALQKFCTALALPMPQLGAMIETPAAAMTADLLAKEADFFSIGTNDLTQYGLAIDRTHPDIAGRLDALHPAVLRLIGTAGSAAAAAKKPIGICGGLGADPLAPAVLIGLGVTEFSVPPASIAMVKARIRALSLPQCRALAEAALSCDSAKSVRALLQTSLSHPAESRT